MVRRRLYLAVLAALSFLVAAGNWLVLFSFIIARGGYWYEPNPYIAWAEFGLSCGLVFMSVVILSWLIYSRRGYRA